VCSPDLHKKLSQQHTNDSDANHINMKFGFVNSNVLRPMLEEGKSFSRIIPIIPSCHKTKERILKSLSTRKCYTIPFDKLLHYSGIQDVQDNPDFADLVKLVARLNGQNLVDKPPVASQPPDLMHLNKCAMFKLLF